MINKKYKRLAGIVLLCTVCFFSACSDNRKLYENNEKITNEMSEISELEEFNPFNLSLDIYKSSNDDVYVDDSETVKYLASYSHMKNDENEYSNICIHKCDEKNVLLEYKNAETKKRHLVLFDKKTGNVIKEHVFETDKLFIDKKTDCIAVSVMEQGEHCTKTFDFDLNEIGNYEFKNCDDVGEVSGNGERFYYSISDRMYVYDSKTKETKELHSEDKYLVDELTGVVTDEEGNDYVYFTGVAADYKLYNFLYDVTGNEILYVSAETDSFEVKDSLLLKCFWEKDNFNLINWIVRVSKEKTFHYELSDKAKQDEDRVALHVLQNGDLLFSSSGDGELYITLCDKETAAIKGTTVIDTRNIRSIGTEQLMKEQMKQYNDMMELMDEPIYVKEDCLLLTLSDFYGMKHFVQWQVGKSVDYELVKVSDGEKELEQSIDISKFDNNLLMPGELSENLLPLKKEIDILEDKYEVDIRIGEECAGLTDGYIVYPLTDYETVKSAIEQLAKELGKYPTNFLQQIRYDQINEILIYLSAEIKGTNNENLDTAGGFKATEGDKLILVIDCKYGQNLKTTFHHELSHAIDEFILYKERGKKNPVFDERQWNQLNPHEDMYTRTYEQFGKDEYYHYTYGYGMSNEINEAYFVDDYSMTFPTEDRARIFENVMQDYGRFVEFEHAPNLRRKLNYYAAGIRAAFDTTGWENVLWERYSDIE